METLLKSFTTSVSESLLYLKDCGRIKFVQNTWAGVDSLIKKVSGRVRDIKHGTKCCSQFSELYIQYKQYINCKG